jgi:hypothetical protein
VPLSGAGADTFRKYPGEMALIGKATIDCDIRERRIRVQQFVLGPLDPKAEQPLVTNR